MIHVRLGERGIDGTRIAVSPLLEVVHSLELLHRHPDRAPWPYTAWADTARRFLDTSELAPLRVFGDIYGVDHGRTTPDMFSPIPVVAAGRIGDELERLSRTPPAIARAQLGAHYPEGVPGFLGAYARDPGRALTRLAAAIQRFWELALAPVWPALRIALAEEVLARARTLALEGAEAVLHDLGAPVSWSAPVLTLGRQVDAITGDRPSARPAARRSSSLLALEQRLLLVPSIFAEDRAMVSTDDPDTLMVSYQSRGAAVLDEDPARALAAASAPASRASLGVLIGDGRAAVLRAVDSPATTTGIAAMLGTSPSTVSEHLTALRRAGVVGRRRVGRQVIYELEPAGRTLLALPLAPTA